MFQKSSWLAGVGGSEYLYKIRSFVCLGHGLWKEKKNRLKINWKETFFCKINGGSGMIIV